MKWKRMFFVAVLVNVSLVMVMVLRNDAGSPTPPNPPGSTSSYTLGDIYNRLHDGTDGSKSTFTEPTGGPGTPTMHTLDEIMAKAPKMDNTNGATPADVIEKTIHSIFPPDTIPVGKNYWGLTSQDWGPQRGTIPVQEIEQDTVIQDAGYYEDFDLSKRKVPPFFLWWEDNELIPDNIKDGVSVYGVVGTHGNRERFVDNGDGTVTDLEMDLMWIKNPSDLVNFPSGARMDWYDASTYCEILDFANHTDWRLPDIWELFSLIETWENCPKLVDDHPFTGVKGVHCFLFDEYYWSQTRSHWSTCTPFVEGINCYCEHEVFLSKATCIYLGKGEVREFDTDEFYYIWPVRDL